MKITNRFRPLLLSLLIFGTTAVPPSLAEPTPLTLEKIMSQPTWIGQWPEEVRFAPNGKTLMYQRHAAARGTEVVETDRRGKVLEVHNTADLPGSISRLDGSTLYSWQGDLFLANPARQRITRTAVAESAPRWLAPNQFVYSVGDDLLVENLSTHSQSQVATFITADSEDPEKTFVATQQDRFFPVLQQRQEFEESQEKVSKIPELALPGDQELIRAELRPDQRYLLAIHEPQVEAKRDQMPVYNTRDGYVKTEDLRVKVGDSPASNQQLTLFDLKDNSYRSLDYTSLPTWSEDRPVRVEDLSWSPKGGGRLALMLLSQDYEDRWLVEVDFENAKLRLIEHLHDPAWHSWDLNEFGWTEDGKTFWYQSEKTGYAHLYLWDGSSSRALTKGDFEATAIHPTPDGKRFFFRANRERPSQYNIFEVDTKGVVSAVTKIGGIGSYDLSPDGKDLVFLHSTIDHPPEMYLQKAVPGAPAEKISNFTSAEFEAIDWTLPEIVNVPSTHQPRPIPAKLYLPASPTPQGSPAVVFIHGAGYLQNSDERWSYYFHEFMFHTLLNQMGVTVLDMDYRASAGYGRDWRTAIYRNMGTPELEDLKDGVAYLSAEHGVDPKRVGVYGGSYGGFLTLMALFKEPDLFACGAALRPVTDWAQYEHDYTARILNTPKEDPEAYLVSSPIEFAQGLQKPLLMAHGMLDDNVVAQDTVRLSQRLIQLEKEDWEMALYPVEPHGFIEASSWLDEYRRILKLFRTHLKF